MEGIAYQHGRLHVDGVDLEMLASSQGTPFYVYSASSILARYRALKDAFADLDPGIRYAVKANSNGAILEMLRAEGCGFDLVSGGELERVLRVGADPKQLAFAGVGKQDWEIRLALEKGIGLFNIESEAEVDLLEELSQEIGCQARVALRLNPDVDPKTHEYISTGKKENKFGLSFDSAAGLIPRIQESAHLELKAYHVHLGSLLLEPGPYLEAVERVLTFIDQDPIRSQGIEAYDMGGGFGIRDLFGDPLDLEGLAAGMSALLKPRGWTLLLEPGRYLMGNAGLLVSRVLHRKRGHEKDFLVVDASMSELIRPALYGAEHHVLAVHEGGPHDPRPVDVVGPVCESADFLAKERLLPKMDRGDLLAVTDSGAYGFTMASNYNSRSLPAEVLCHEGQARLIRRREALADLWRDEVSETLDLS
jgi:diaminopimelate decarboxylase